MPVQSEVLIADPEVDALLRTLLDRVQASLGERFLGLYLGGSLAAGGFDEGSDIDFVVVLDQTVAAEQFTALQTMHEALAASASKWAFQLEGSYMPLQALRRYDPAWALQPHIDRDRGERLRWLEHGEFWTFNRHVFREHGRALAGPPLGPLIDPISADDLRRASRSALYNWAAGILRTPEVIARRGYQSYVVLTLCRLLYTLESGRVVPKPDAAGWARQALGGMWAGLIERAWIGRMQPDLAADPGDAAATLAFIRFAQEKDARSSR